MAIAAIILVLLLAFANGANDVSKSAATLVGGRLTHYSQALRWGSLWTTAGALLGGVLASGLATRFANALGPEGQEQAAIPIAVLIGAMLWVGLSSRLGLPRFHDPRHHRGDSGGRVGRAGFKPVGAA